MKKNTTREGWEFEELNPSSFDIDQTGRVWRLYRGGELIKEEFYYNNEQSIFLLADKKEKSLRL